MRNVLIPLFYLFALVAAKADPRPNILIILADDLGFSDLGCYGGEIHTPNLDSLAKDGLRFTQFYNSSRCCPSRASLLTGLYPHEAGIGEMTTSDAHLPGYEGHLKMAAVTIAEALKPAGYYTAMSGKWHLSLTKEVPRHMKYLNNQKILSQFSDPATYPASRGFDDYYGIIWGVADYFDPFSLVEGKTPVETVSKDYYITDAITDHSIKYIEKAAGAKQPFFLYLAYTAPHWPVMAPAEDIAKYKDTYKVGWEAIREARYKRMIAMGLFDEKTTPLSARTEPNRSWEDNPNKEYEAGAMATHAAMVDHMDQSIGRVMETLKKTGQWNNTLIVFLSDNGASDEEYEQSGFDRASETRDGRHIAYPAEMKKKGILPGAETTWGYIGQRWANAANTPFRFWKAHIYEGGICTPFIVHWPVGLKTQPGTITAQIGHVMDLLPTCLDLAHANYPTSNHGLKTPPLEGKSLEPIFEGRQRTPHDFIGWEHQGGRGIRQGDWKLVSFDARAPWELYNLANDRTETHNLAASEPTRVKQMAEAWSKWAHAANVIPAPDHRFQEDD